VRPSLLIPVVVATLSAALPVAAAQVVPSPGTCVPSGGLVYVGDSSAPPVEFIDEKGRPAGIHVDLLRALEREIGIPITIRLMQKLEATTAMLRGEAQITAMALADSRKAEFDFLSPTVRSRLSVILRSRFKERAASRDLSGLRIATTREV
jgi:ABC-type amino acid transport substrate-binding protein